MQRIPLCGQASEGVHRQSRLVNVRAPTSAIPRILAAAWVHQIIEWVRSWVENDNPVVAAAFDFEWMNAKRIAQLKQGQKGHRPVQNNSYGRLRLGVAREALVNDRSVLSEIGLFCFSRGQQRDRGRR